MQACVTFKKKHDDIKLFSCCSLCDWWNRRSGRSVQRLAICSVRHVSLQPLQESFILLALI